MFWKNSVINKFIAKFIIGIGDPSSRNSISSLKADMNITIAASIFRFYSSEKLYSKFLLYKLPKSTDYITENFLLNFSGTKIRKS